MGETTLQMQSAVPNAMQLTQHDEFRAGAFIHVALQSGLMSAMVKTVYKYIHNTYAYIYVHNSALYYGKQLIAT